MDFEPSAKRRRTLSPELGQQYTGDPYPAQFLDEPAEDDEAYKLYLERAFADPRFRDTVAKIFDKYGQKNAADDVGPSVEEPAGDPVDPALSGFEEDQTIDDMLSLNDAGVEMEAAARALELFRQDGKDSIPDDVTSCTEYTIADYEVERKFIGGHGSFTAQPGGGYVPNFGQLVPPFDPRFPMMPTWYGPVPPPWEGYSMPFGMPSSAAGAWSNSNGLVYAPGPWPISSIPLNGELPTQPQHQQQREKSESTSLDDKTPTMPPPPPPFKPGKAHTHAFQRTASDWDVRRRAQRQRRQRMRLQL